MKRAKYRNMDERDEVTINTLITIAVMSIMAFIGWIAIK